MREGKSLKMMTILPWETFQNMTAVMSLAAGYMREGRKSEREISEKLVAARDQARAASEIIYK
jgi:hypothetical protein